MQRHSFMSASTQLVTAEEFAQIPRDGYKYELVEGRIVRMSPAGIRHGMLVGRILLLLSPPVEAGGFGVVLTPSGFKLASNPDTVREPDVSFIRRERIPPSGLPDAYWSGPPDLAIEVRSPGDRPSLIREKIEDYLTRGVTLIWLVDPKEQTVTAYRRLSPPVVHGTDDTLSGEDLVPGFTCPVRKIFE